MKTIDFTKHVTSFFTSYLGQELGCGVNTIQSYSISLKLFWRFLKENKGVDLRNPDLPQLNKIVVTEFLDWLETSRHLQPRSRNVRLAAIKSFFNYVSKNDIQYLELCRQIATISFKRGEEKIPNYLTLEGIKLLLTQPNLKTVKGRRDMLLLSVMYDSGCRVQEIINLTPEKIMSFDKHLWIKVIGKGQKHRQIALSNNYNQHLEFYLREHGLDKSENQARPLFFGKGGSKLTRAGIGYILHKYLVDAAKINKKIIPDEISCHSLRHSRAVHLLEADVNIVHIRDILGHSSVTTTERYARLGTEYKLKAIDKAYTEIAPDLKINSASDDDWLGNYLDSLR